MQFFQPPIFRHEVIRREAIRHEVIRRNIWVAAAVILPLLFVFGAAPLTASPVALAAAPAGKNATSPTNKSRFQKKADILKFISNYRFDGKPDDLPALVRAMSRHNLLRNQEKNGIYVGFIAGVLGTHQLQAKRYVAKMFPLQPEEQPVIIKAIAFSGLPDWKNLMKSFIERMPARRVLIERYLYGKEPLLMDLSFAKGPAVLDTHWGYYFATGLYEPVTRIIAALQWSTHKTDLKKLTIGSMAKWTLATNASRDKLLLDLCRQELEVISKKRRPPLLDVVNAAQSFNTDKIQADALSAIDKLKRNPKPGSGKWYSAANIGSTVLALGCVVASATGHAELGIPCVITGALSSAALKLWGNKLVTSPWSRD